MHATCGHHTSVLTEHLTNSKLRQSALIWAGVLPNSERSSLIWATCCPYSEQTAKVAVTDTADWVGHGGLALYAALSLSALSTSSADDF